MNGKNLMLSHSTKKLTDVHSNTIGVKRLGWGKKGRVLPMFLWWRIAIHSSKRQEAKRQLVLSQRDNVHSTDYLEQLSVIILPGERGPAKNPPPSERPRFHWNAARCWKCRRAESHHPILQAHDCQQPNPCQPPLFIFMQKSGHVNQCFLNRVFAPALILALNTNKCSRQDALSTGKEIRFHFLSQMARGGIWRKKEGQGKDEARVLVRYTVAN